MEAIDGNDGPETKRDSMDTPITFTIRGSIIPKEDLLLYTKYTEDSDENQKQDKKKYRTSWDEKTHMSRCLSFTSNDSGYDSRRATAVSYISSSDAEEQKFDVEVTDTSQK